VAVEFDLKINREVAWTTLRDHATTGLAARMSVPVGQLGVSCLRPAGTFRRTAIVTCTPLGLTFGDTE
jgi:hypothetical protein